LFTLPGFKATEGICGGGPLLFLSLGNLHWSQGKVGPAEDLFRRCLAVQEKTLSPEDFRLSFALLPLGRLLSAAGRSREGLPLLERALVLRQGLAENHRLRAEAEGELGLALAAAGQEGPARLHLQAGLSAFQAKSGPETAFVQRLGEVLATLETPTEEGFPESLHNFPTR